MTRRLQNLTLRASLLVERAPRFNINLDGEMTSRTIAQHNVPVINLSQTGCLLLSDLSLPIETSVLLTIPGIGMHGAIVRRVTGREHGMAFRLPLSERNMEGVRKKFPEAINRPAADFGEDVAPDEPGKALKPSGARSLLGRLSAAFGK